MEPSQTPSVFLQEIKAMMYSFGDSQCPSTESAALIERITHQQMTRLIVHTADVTNMRCARSMSVDDVLFLLRKNKDKLQRLVRHLNFKSSSKKASGGQATDEDLDDFDTFQQPGQKRKRFSTDFLSAMDQLDDEASDTVHQERLRQQDDLTRDMNVDQYVQYTACRQVNFHKNISKFKEWLDIGSLIDLKPSQEMIEVFGYLSYEVVREIVELSLLVKKDMETQSTYPSGLPSLSLPPASLSDFGSTMTFHTTPSTSSPSSHPTTAPPPPSSSSSPSPPSSSAVQPAMSPHAGTSPSVAVVHSRKRKTGNVLLEQPVIPQVGISTTHIREAMRRKSFQIGPLLPLSTHFTKPTFSQRALCA